MILHHVILLELRTVRRLQDFWETCAPERFTVVSIFRMLFGIKPTKFMIPSGQMDYTSKWEQESPTYTT